MFKKGAKSSLNFGTDVIQAIQKHVNICTEHKGREELTDGVSFELLAAAA